MARPRILLADDHRLVAEGLRSLLSREFELVGVVEDGLALLEAAKRDRPDVVVADLSMPRLNGLDALPRLKAELPTIKVVILTMHAEAAYARRAMEAGAAGYVLKHSAPAELLTALRAVLEGKTYLAPSLAKSVRSMQSGGGASLDPAARLTPRQRSILQLLAEGRSAKSIAAALGISSRTVEFHKYQMMESLKVSSSAELILFGIKHGLVVI